MASALILTAACSAVRCPVMIFKVFVSQECESFARKVKFIWSSSIENRQNLNCCHLGWVYREVGALAWRPLCLAVTSSWSLCSTSLKTTILEVATLSGISLLIGSLLAPQTAPVLHNPRAIPSSLLDSLNTSRTQSKEQTLASSLDLCNQNWTFFYCCGFPPMIIAHALLPT